MHDEVSDGNRFAFRYFGDVIMVDLLSIDNSNTAESNGLKVMTAGDHNASVFTQSDSDDSRLCSNGLCEAVKSASFVKMRIDNNVFQKAETGSHFHFALQVGVTCIAFVYHHVTH